MLIYLAGNTKAKVLNSKKLKTKKISRLSSFFYKNDAIKTFERSNKRPTKFDMLLDSGAYSAWSQEKEIDIVEYADFIKEHNKELNYYANLDVIGNAKGTWKNQKKLEKLGVSPIPVFHVGEDFKYLERYISLGYKYIALGGLVRTKGLPAWLDNVWSKYLTDSKGKPIVKVHGFGLTSHDLMLRYPWFSVDSSRWVITAAVGSIFVPPLKNSWALPPWSVDVSSLSPRKDKPKGHITTYSKKEQEIFLNYFKEQGYKLGKSKVVEVDKSYVLQKNEKWVTKGKQIERVLKNGLSNNYRLRMQLNAIYYLDLQENVAPYPRTFKKQSPMNKIF